MLKCVGAAFLSKVETIGRACCMGSHEWQSKKVTERTFWAGHLTWKQPNLVTIVETEEEASGLAREPCGLWQSKPHSVDELFFSSFFCDSELW